MSPFTFHLTNPDLTSCDRLSVVGLGPRTGSTEESVVVRVVDTVRVRSHQGVGSCPGFVDLTLSGL